MLCQEAERGRGVEACNKVRVPFFADTLSAALEGGRGVLSRGVAY